jgi:predicted Zn-dependent protease
MGGKVGPVDLGVLGGVAGLMTAAATKIEQEDEVKIGRGVAARLLGQYGIWPDPVLRSYVTLVGQALVQSVGRQGLTYHFAILKDEGVNAYSAPGGYVFVTRGALRQMRDESELAGVLAHEIAHVNLRHVLTEIENRYFMQKAGETATQVMSTYGGSGGQATLAALQAGGPVFSQIADGAAELLYRGFNRSQEAEADKSAADYARRTGYDPGGLLRFLETSQARSQRKEAAVAALMRTHPIYAERTAELRAQIAAGGGGRLVRLEERYLAATTGRP